jgi:hypothetical protein
MTIIQTLATTTAAAAIAVFTATPVEAAVTTAIERNPVSYTEPTFGPCDGNAGTLTVEGEAMTHVTDTGKTFQLSSTTRAVFSYVPDDPTLPSASGHFVSRETINVNSAQLKDARQRLLTRAIAVSEDGDRFPILFTTVILYTADGGVDVLIDEVRCLG